MTTYQRATGAAIDRIEGRAKVHGDAKYAYEYEARDVAYAVLVTSTIARGEVVSVQGADGGLRRARGVPHGGGEGGGGGGAVVVARHRPATEKGGGAGAAEERR